MKKIKDKICSNHRPRFWRVGLGFFLLFSGSFGLFFFPFFSCFFFFCCFAHFCSVGDQDMHLRINRVVDDLMVEGVNAALQELQRRSPPPSSSGETSAVSFGSGWDSTHSSPFDTSPRSPFDRSLERFAEPLPPQVLCPWE